MRTPIPAAVQQVADGSASPRGVGRAINLTVELPTASVGGTLLLPSGGGPAPCAVIVGGTLSPLRDGDSDRPGMPGRDALKRLAEALAADGYASFRYDHVGHGQSRPKAGWPDLYQGDARVLAGLYEHLRARPECSQVIAIGESAGAYVACLAARAGAHADAYVFLGGFCGKAEEIFSYNHGRLARYVESSPANAAWAEANELQRYVAFGRHWGEMFAAAKARCASWDLVDGDLQETVPLARRIEELDLPPDEMFGHVERPALAVAGSRDRNVPPHHAACAVAIMQRAGNFRTESRIIERADHSFQIAPDDDEAAIRERFTFASFRNPYHPGLHRTVLSWLRQHVPVPPRAVEAPELDPATSDSPARLDLAPGVTLIDNILDSAMTPGVETAEGRIGPLLRAPGMRAHFIDMPAGLFLEEHPHAKGSIIYTVRGSWGLKSRDRWHLMKPGSLYWFGDDVPTGFQVPFTQPAFILIFKSIEGDPDAVFMAYLRRLALTLEQEEAGGTPFRLIDLPAGHSALAFARQSNPKFDAEFPRSR